MISVLVIRGAGDRPGPDISDPLITTPTVAIARGTTEIDRQITHRQEVTVSGPLISDVAPGSLVQYSRADGSVLTGKLTAYETVLQISGDQVTADTTLSLEVDHG